MSFAFFRISPFAEGAGSIDVAPSSRSAPGTHIPRPLCLLQHMPLWEGHACRALVCRSRPDSGSEPNPDDGCLSMRECVCECVRVHRFCFPEHVLCGLSILLQNMSVLPWQFHHRFPDNWRCPWILSLQVKNNRYLVTIVALHRALITRWAQVQTLYDSFTHVHASATGN